MAIFDEFAYRYDEWYKCKKGSFIDKIETTLAFKMFQMKKGMKILDVGCGTGNFSIRLAEMGCRVTGIDVSEKMLEIARIKAAEKNLDIDFINMDAHKLEFADNEFDAVISMATFEFIDAPQKALDEFFRVVKVGGQVLVGTIAADSAWGEFYRNKDKRDSIFRYANFKTLEDMKGWKPEKLMETGECLFVSPLSDESEFNEKLENELSGKRKGGYICALWRK
ncbi:UbiE/COQ5 methyltransferase (plasmid) [Peptoclostridium acidaminophilum DSM 3953]|uniref:UbiE/COQ5 methyltransferase n=1 Tax=Peptoclostridium acidaminophilum DSM 3953 TaxID=1286171 RepID=W8T7Z6_PEPAC|nr:class I SAM-dependent methyltransferase [Peptoclostridium acidaminophilum]AHM57849.1 UbiE/COQ5 methyltransferase [Peptoclostridium acidaminophilum DSM 3953]